MRSTRACCMAGVLAVAPSLGCTLEVPPAVEPEPAVDVADASTDPDGGETSPTGEGAEASEQAPGIVTPSELDTRMSAPACDVVVMAVLDSGRALWQGVGKYRCTYEIHVDGVPYRYTRLMPRERERKRKAAEACERGRSSMESVVRAATRNCREMQVIDRYGQGLVPIR